MRLLPMKTSRVPVVTGINAGRSIPDDLADWQITGHTQIKTFLRYLNLGSDAVQNAATLLGQYTNSVTVVESDTVN